ncbi:MAG: glycoside hydrolase family 16 protein [Deltaproteobacteria bacterium]|nr:glycoside hydrolase family 16 protein [Deltaproteobacteria bacterium]
MLLLLIVIACSSTPQGEGQWVVIWADEFRGASGEPPDPSRWTYDVGGDGWGNGQLEYNTDRVENAAQNGDGVLEIVARKEDYEGNAYTSARIKTDGLFEHGYGRFEARIRVPEGKGLWPAFWMLGAEFNDIGWPWCGEVDVLEMKGEAPETIYGTIHGPGYSGSGGISGGLTLDDGAFSDGYHNYAVEIDEGHIAWLVDDVVYQRITAADLPADATWVNDDPFFLILNLAVGGNYVAAPDETTELPATMKVDWVRVSERAW